MKLYDIIVEEHNNSYSAYTLEEDIAITTRADSLDELMLNLIEAFELYFEDDKIKFEKENFRLLFSREKTSM